MLAVFMVACGSSDDSAAGGGASASCDGASGGPGLECEVLALVNQMRAAGATCGGKSMPPAPALEMHATLRQVARSHAEDMAKNDYFSHTSLDGRSPFERMKDAGYQYSSAAENIAAGSATADAVMAQWTSSGLHCENIMTGGFQHIGVGYAPSTGKYAHVWVQTFGAQ